MGYKDFKDLPKRTTSDKVLHDKSFDIVKNLKYDGCQLRLASMLFKFFDKNFGTAGENKYATNTKGSAIKSKFMSIKYLAEELHKTIIRKFEKGKL